MTAGTEHDSAAARPSGRSTLDQALESAERERAWVLAGQNGRAALSQAEVVALADEIKRLRQWAYIIGDVRATITAYATGGYGEREALEEIDQLVNRPGEAT